MEPAAADAEMDGEMEGGHDTAPGSPPLDERGIVQAIAIYAVGFVLASGLTIAAFIAPATGLIWAPALPVALMVFAVAQMGVHLVFFLHITTGPDNTNNALALAFGVLIVFLVMAGSLWIMANLNHNMPPMDQIMRMQR